MIKLYYKNTYIAEVNTDLEFQTVQDMLLYLHLSLEDLTTILDEKINGVDNFRMEKTMGYVKMNYYATSQPDYSVKCENIVKVLLHIKQYCISYNVEKDYTKRHLISNSISEAMTILQLLGVKIELEEIKIKNRKSYRTIQAYANCKKYVIKMPIVY